MNRNLKLFSSLIILVLGVTLTAASVSAVSSRNFRAHLTGDNEVPPVDNLAQGQAIFKVGKDGTTIEYKLIVANIENVTQAHIHLGGPDVNGPVDVFLYGFTLIPGRFNGVLAEGTITDTDLIISGSISELLGEIMAGNTYVNVHTIQNPGGEVRGQI